jgi:hypothetical protein
MGRNLEALNNIFRDAPSPWHIVAMARTLPQGDLPDVHVQEPGEKALVELKEHA